MRIYEGCTVYFDLIFSDMFDSIFESECWAASGHNGMRNDQDENSRWLVSKRWDCSDHDNRVSMLQITPQNKALERDAALEAKDAQ